MATYIIGCGGVGSWLAASLVKLIGPKQLVLVDGDLLEEKNLDRQLFTREQIGQNKAEALGRLHGCSGIPGWYSSTLIQHHKRDWLIGVVDNHPARSSILAACDFAECRAILASNETHSAEAFVYLPKWRGTRLDPRTYYPEIETVRTGDPRAAAIGCTGEAQEENRQLVSANFMAASLAQHLYVIHALTAGRLEPEAVKKLPHHLSVTLSRMEYKPIGEPGPQIENERTEHE